MHLEVDIDRAKPTTGILEESDASALTALPEESIATASPTAIFESALSTLIKRAGLVWINATTHRYVLVLVGISVPWRVSM